MKLIIPILILELIFTYVTSKVLNDSFAVIKTNLIIKGVVVLISSLLIIFLMDFLNIGKNKLFFYIIIFIFISIMIFLAFFFVKEVKDNFFVELYKSFFIFSLFIRLYFPLILSLVLLMGLELLGVLQIKRALLIKYT